MDTCMLTHHSGHGLNTKRFTQIPRLIRQQWVCQPLSLPANGAMHSQQDSMLAGQKCIQRLYSTVAALLRMYKVLLRK